MTGAQPPVRLSAMPKITISRPEQPSAATFHDRVRVATELLESIVADRGLLLRIDPGDRHRLLQAAGHVYAPDAAARRQLVRASSRRRKAEKVRREETALDADRDPDASPADGVHQPQRLSAGPASSSGRSRDPEFREAVEPQHCYVCKQKYTAIHHFYDQLCPPCAGVQLRQAHRAGGSAGPGGAADRRPGQDRLPGGHQAAAVRRTPDRHHPFPPRLGGPLRPRSRTSPTGAHRLEIFGLDLRHTPSVEAFCRRAAGNPRPARLHRQQRLPDRPPAARVLRAHDGARDGGPPRHAGARPPAARELRGVARRSPASRRHRGRQAVTPAAFERRLPSIAGLANSAELSQVPLLAEEHRPQRHLFPGGPARSGPAAGGPAGAELVADAAGRRAVGRAAGGAAGQRGGAVHPQRAAQAAACCAPRSGTSTSSTSRRSKASSTGTSRPRAIRTPTWPRPRST